MEVTVTQTRKAISLVMAVVFIFASACATYHYEGAAVGGAVGGTAGALLDNSNPWRGGVIGAALGALFGATITEVAVQGRREAAYSNRPVEYKTEDGRGVYRADPLDYDARTKCRKVQERVWEDERLVKDEIKEVCEGEKYERRY
jgi:hypothetical protein